MSKGGQVRVNAINKITEKSASSYSPLEIFVIICIIAAFVIIAVVIISLAVLFIVMCWWVIAGLINGF